MKLLPHILVISQALLLMAADKKKETRAGDLAAPVRIEAAGKPITVGFAAPFMHDFDGDGKDDLLVGQFYGGSLRIYRNIGTKRQPKFGKFEWFKAGGEVGRINAACRVGFSPQLVDFDGDGHFDILSGSIWGYPFFFRGTEGGNFAKSKILRHKNGNLIQVPHNATVFAHDWDADGDLDLLISGSRKFCLIPNEGSREKPAFGEPEKLQADGKDIRRGLHSPCVADWDGDGRDDLILGSGGGNVLWYRNVGDKGKPVLAAPVALVSMTAHRDEGPGGYAKICVVDFNKDGQLDLLVGDSRYRDVEKPKLSDEQKAAKKEAQARYSAAIREYHNLWRTPDDESDEARLGRQDKIVETLKQLAQADAVLDETRGTEWRPQGYVWLFLRQ